MVNVYSTDGEKVGEIKLPVVFEESVRNDLIMRAFLSEQSKLLQPKGPFKWAGMETSARYVGRKEAYHTLKNRGIARGPRVMFPKGRIGAVRRVPFAVKGRRAHPPKPEKKIIEEMNKKEKEKALRSAIAATADQELVKRRHKINVDVPIVFDEKFEEIKKTKDAMKILRMIIGEDLKRAKRGRKKREKRKKGTKTPKSALVISVTQKPILNAVKNIPGIDSVSIDKLNVSLLAPGGVPGRLTIWTKSAIEELKGELKSGGVRL